MSKEKWNKIVDLYNKHSNSQETIIQAIWESIFTEILGYSRLNGDIDAHRSIRIGSTERVIPDIIIKNGEKDLFVVELKQHNIFHNNGIERQLLSYLKLLNLEIGILICQKIYVYSRNHDKNDYEQSKLEIDFTKDNPYGIKFIELFSNNNYNKTAINQLIVEKTQSDKNVQEIKSKLTNEYVLKLIKTHFSEEYNEIEIDTALNDYNISILENRINIYNSALKNEHYNKYNEKSMHTTTKVNTKEKRKFFENFTINNIQKVFRGKKGFQAINSKGQEIGIVFMSDDKRQNYGNCELCMYENFFNEYGQWHRFTVNGQKIKWEDLVKRLNLEGSIKLFIE